jgi:anti-anti-sigma factor
MMTQTMSPVLELEFVALPPSAGILLRGEVDIATLPLLELALDTLADPVGAVTVDLTELTFIDVMGCRALANAAIRWNAFGHCLALRGASPGLRHILNLLGWSHLFTFRLPNGMTDGVNSGIARPEARRVNPDQP